MIRKLLSVLLLALVFALPVQAKKVQEPKDLPITATSWLVADGNGRIINSQNPNETRSIASITKLMTAMIVLDAQQELDQHLGQYTRAEWMSLMLVRSDNHAADVLCDSYVTGRSGCIRAMNNKATDMGLRETHYADPSGLNVMNVSTANELVQIVLEAAKYNEIKRASRTLQGTMLVQTSVKQKKKKHTKTQFVKYNNTNPLVSSYNFIVSKTGYIRASGGCIVMMMNTELGERIVVLLNSKNTHTRIPEAQKLALSN